MKKPSKILYFGKKALAFLLSVLVLSLAVFYVSRLAPGPWRPARLLLR